MQGAKKFSVFSSQDEKSHSMHRYISTSAGWYGKFEESTYSAQQGGKRLLAYGSSVAVCIGVFPGAGDV